MKKIMFVCSGNIFRSMTAEHALKAFLGGSSDFIVESAGTHAIPQPMAECVRERLLERGIDPGDHQPRRLTQDMIDNADLIVAMGRDHQAHIRLKHNLEVPLFNEISHGKSEPILDVWEVVDDLSDMQAKVEYAVSVVDYICDAIPLFEESMEVFFRKK